MSQGKKPYAPSSRSTQYRCPRCSTFVHITAHFVPDPGFGDTIEVTVYCPKCKDGRVDSIDQFAYDLAKLVSKIGT